MTDKVSAFFDAWALEDDAVRLTAITGSMTADASYADPRMESPVIGPAAIAEYVVMFSQSAPGAVAEVTKSETRAGVTRATIAFKMPNGMEQTGQYFIETDQTGLITRMVGFVGTGAAE